MKLAIAGIPKSGKTTISDKISPGTKVFHTDDLIKTHSWSEASLEVSNWFKIKGDWIIEGVAVPRALRKWLAANKDKPCDKILWLEKPHEELNKGQLTMAKGCITVMDEIRPELIKRGVEILTEWKFEKKVKEKVKSKKTATKKVVLKSGDKVKQTKPKQEVHHTLDEYKKAIAVSGGIYVNIARKLKLTRGAVTLFIKNHPELKDIIFQKREEWIDKAENELFNQIDFEDEDDPVPAARVRQKASELVATRLGKDRGWVEKHEQAIEHSGNVALTAKQLYDEVKRERTGNKRSNRK